jgi:hypothetical protein
MDTHGDEIRMTERERERMERLIDRRLKEREIGTKIRT